MDCTWNVAGIDLEYAWNWPGMCLEYTWNGPGPGINPKIGLKSHLFFYLDFPQIPPRMTWNDMEWIKI